MFEELQVIRGENTSKSTGRIALAPTAKRLVRKMAGMWDLDYSMAVGLMVVVLEDMTYDEAKALVEQQDKSRVVGWLARQARRYNVERALLRTLLSSSEGNTESEKT